MMIPLAVIMHVAQLVIPAATDGVVIHAIFVAIVFVAPLDQSAVGALAVQRDGLAVTTSMAIVSTSK